MEILLQNFNTHADLHRRLTGLFNLFDADGSGQLDYYELRDGLRKLPLARPLELKPSDWVLLTAHLKDQPASSMATLARQQSASSSPEAQKRSILSVFTRSVGILCTGFTSCSPAQRRRPHKLPAGPSPAANKGTPTRIARPVRGLMRKGYDSSGGGVVACLLLSVTV